MPYILTDRQLQLNIMSLKDSLDDFYRQNDRKLVYINAFSFYDHISRLPDVTGLLDAIEPYIPMRFGTESINLFLQTAREAEQNEDKADYFTLKARVDFIESLRKADNPESWAKLLSVCGAIRDIKEQLMLLAAT